MLRQALVALAAFGIVASSGSLAAEPDPWGIHVAFGEDASSVATIAWATTYAGASFVEFGPTAQLGARVEAMSRPALGGTAVLHEARLEALPAGSTIFYRVGSDGAWSPRQSFRTMAEDPASFRFIAAADWGTTAQAWRTRDAILAAAPDFLLVAGDMPYASLSPATWDAWMRGMEPLAATIPMMVAPGNHEVEGSVTGAFPGTTAYRERFAMPGAELYYSFDAGRVHFTILHSTLDGAAREGVLAPMMAFADADLAEAAARRDAGELDLLVVVQHHPIYSSAAGSGATTDRRFNAPLASWQEPLLQRYGVDLLLVGHNHHYERLAPMLLGEAAPQGLGPVHVVSGGAGRSLYNFVDPNDIPSWSLAHARRYHYVELTYEAGLLHGRAIAIDDAPGEVIDAFTIAPRPRIS